MEDVLCKIEVFQWKRLVCRGIEQPPGEGGCRRDATVDADMCFDTHLTGTIEYHLIIKTYHSNHIPISKVMTSEVMNTNWWKSVFLGQV